MIFEVFHFENGASLAYNAGVLTRIMTPRRLACDGEALTGYGGHTMLTLGRSSCFGALTAAPPRRSQAAMLDVLSVAAGTSALILWASIVLLGGEPATSESGRSATSTSSSSGDSSRALAGERETQYGGYIGAPFTHASDVHFSNVGTTDLTVHDVNWDGKPFKSPIYYGLRTLRWGDGWFGTMLDFTHSKAISQRDQVVRISGTRNGKPAPEPQTIEKTFKHLEFSHGHNMLTLNGLARLAQLSPALQPYVGIGAGISLPHTEIQFVDEEKRTYEYQYTGPIGQVLAGLEIRLPRISLFLEYKFTMARYSAPLTGIDSRGWGYGDIPAQVMRYFRGEQPAGGVATTTLASHNLIGGVTVRQPRSLSVR